MRISLFTAVIAVTTLVVMGCGPTAPQVVEVTGTVTLDGKPLDRIQVEFWPEVSGPTSYGLTDDQGRFTLASQDGAKKGAVVGKHKVILQDTSIIVDRRMGREVENVDVTQGKKPRILEEYANPISSTLSAEISPDKRNVDFDVKPYVAR